MAEVTLARGRDEHRIAEVTTLDALKMWSLSYEVIGNRLSVLPSGAVCRRLPPGIRRVHEKP
jgi:hypothetical protein